MTTTVRLLSTYDGNPPQTIVRLPDALAASFVAMGNASLDLTGGINKPATAIPHTVSSAARLIYNDTGTFLGLGDAQGNLLVTPAGLTIPNAFGKPGAPTGFTLTAAAGAVVAAFTAPADLGGDPSTVRYVLSLSNGTKVEGGSSPISAAAPAGTAVSGTVTAISSLGESAPSASATATPTGPAVAIALTLTGPTSGTIGSASGAYTVALSPGGATVAAPVTVTPTAVAGVTFAPASLTLTTAAPSGTFTATATTSGTKAIAVTNNGGLTNPAAINLVIAAASTPATALTLTGPTTATTGSASSAYTVALAPTGGAVTGTVTVTPTPVAGVTFAPTSLSLTTASPSGTFTALLAADGAKTIAITNDGGLTNPSAITLTSSTASTVPQAPAVASRALAGASAADVVITPAASGPAATSYKVQAFKAGVLDTSVIEDPTNAAGATTRRMKNHVPGQSYTYKAIATNGSGDSTASAASAALAQPVMSATSTLVDTLIDYDLKALTGVAGASNTQGITMHNQRTLPASDLLHASIDVYAVNVSTTETCTCTISVSFSAVAGGYTTLGSAVGSANAAALNNAGTWSAPVQITIPVSSGTSVAGTTAAAHGMINIGPILKAALAPLARTDFAGAGIILHIRQYIAPGQPYTYNNMVPNNGANGAAIDYELSKQDPAVSVLGGDLNRHYTAFGVDGVSNIAALTTANALTRFASGMACFPVQKLTGAVGLQLVANDDSRGSFSKSTLKACAGPLNLARAAARTASRPIGLANMSIDGAGPSIWVARANVMAPLFGASLMILPVNSINGWGNASIVNYDTNKASVDTVRSIWVARGARIVSQSVLGVDPTSSGYGSASAGGGWGTSDNTLRHANNITLENGSTAAAPVIPAGTMTEGTLSASGMWNQTDAIGNSWIEMGAGDGTKAHFTYAYAAWIVPQYIPFLQV